MLRELIEHHGLSQREAAQQCARDVSWVQRRLVLLGALPQDLVQAVRSGRISSWAAGRILAPLARANSEHASGLLRSWCATGCLRVNCRPGLRTTNRPSTRVANAWWSIRACLLTV